MVSSDEFGQLISEFESLRDTLIDELAKISSEIENLREDFKDLQKEVVKK